jgi:hypothetical protein
VSRRQTSARLGLPSCIPHRHARGVAGHGPSRLASDDLTGDWVEQRIRRAYRNQLKLHLRLHTRQADGVLKSQIMSRSERFIAWEDAERSRC